MRTAVRRSDHDLVFVMRGIHERAGTASAEAEEDALIIYRMNVLIINVTFFGNLKHEIKQEIQRKNVKHITERLKKEKPKTRDAFAKIVFTTPKSKGKKRIKHNRKFSKRKSKRK